MVHLFKHQEIKEIEYLQNNIVPSMKEMTRNRHARKTSCGLACLRTTTSPQIVPNLLKQT